MPVIRRADDHDLGFLFREQFAVVLVFHGLIAGELLHLLNGGVAAVRVDVAHGDDLAFAASIAQPRMFMPHQPVPMRAVRYLPF